ncbi:hypothetical protein [Paenibacillus sp. GCM10027626]|uniref:hypothetical protein n=1 Tax=Paenibacillus sp. GCM10027626 TaxID=3273411 RepID=UPI0036294B1C
MPVIADRTNGEMGIVVPFKARRRKPQQDPLDRVNKYKRIIDNLKPLHAQSENYRESSGRAAFDDEDDDD